MTSQKQLAALRWYANPKNWQAGKDRIICRALSDLGKRARAALPEKKR